MPSDYVKILLAGLAQAKSPDLPYILPIFSGTSYVGFSSQVKASSFKLKELPLNLLSGANVIAMVEKVREDPFMNLTDTQTINSPKRPHSCFSGISCIHANTA